MTVALPHTAFVRPGSDPPLLPARLSQPTCFSATVAALMDLNSPPHSQFPRKIPENHQSCSTPK